MRRPRVDWMTQADDAILEFLVNRGNHDLVATPAVIAVNIDFNPGYVRQRMRPLLEAGLVAYHDERRGMYRITDLGKRYLAGEVTAEDLTLEGE